MSVFARTSSAGTKPNILGHTVELLDRLSAAPCEAVGPLTTGKQANYPHFNFQHSSPPREIILQSSIAGAPIGFLFIFL